MRQVFRLRPCLVGAPTRDCACTCHSCRHPAERGRADREGGRVHPSAIAAIGPQPDREGRTRRRSRLGRTRHAGSENALYPALLLVQSSLDGPGAPRLPALLMMRSRSRPTQPRRHRNAHRTSNGHIRCPACLPAGSLLVSRKQTWQSEQAFRVKRFSASSTAAQPPRNLLPGSQVR